MPFISKINGSDISASYAVTASYALTGGSGGGTVDTGSLVTTSSFNAFTSSINTFTSSYNTGSFSGSFTGELIGTASWAQSSSNAINSQTASFLPVGTYQITSSWATNALTSSTINLNALVPATAYIVGTGTTGGGEKILSNNIFSYTTATSTINATSSWANTSSKVVGGTTNYVPLWTAGTTLGSSVLYQSSNNIGLGTTSPNTVLHISASSAQPLLNIENNTPTGYTNMRFTGTGRKYIIGVGNASETFFGIADDFFLYDDTSGNIRMIVDPNGNVGIGTVSPSSLLQVNGTVTANSFVGNLTGTASFASNLNNGVSFLGSGSIITGSTAISSSYGLYVPANTFTVGNIVKVQGVFTKPNAASSMNFYIYINTSNSLSGATQLALYQTTTQRWNPITRTLAIESSTSTTLHPTNVSHYNDDIVLIGATARASVNINWAIDQYILFAAQNAATSDRTDTFRFYAKKI